MKIIGRFIIGAGLALWFAAGALSLFGAPIWEFWFVSTRAAPLLLVGLGLIFVGGLVEGEWWDA